MRYAYAETTPVLNLAAPSQIRGGWPEVGTTAAESARLPHTQNLKKLCYKAFKGLLKTF